MRVKPYWNYFKYILEHKKNVFIECWKAGLYSHAFTHDLSKFSKYEFTAYAGYFYIDKAKYEDAFEIAWVHHYRNNPHHWDYWLENGKPMDMPHKYITQMLCDWKAMSRKLGGSAQTYYLTNYKKINLSKMTRFIVESSLGLGCPGVCQCDAFYWCTLEEIVNSSLERIQSDPEANADWFKNYFLAYYKNNYNVDLIDVLKK